MLTVGGLFSGIGGIELGFQEAGFKIKWSNEIDKYAVLTLKENFSHQVYHCDIEKLYGHMIESVDILVAGFPCQAFSIAGYRKGFEDKRGNVFFHIIRIINELDRKPKVIFLENVKNLYGHDNGRTFAIIQENLEQLGYKIKYQILNAKEYGNTPQNRERVYIVCFLDDNQYDSFLFPKKIPLTKTATDLLSKQVDKTFYYTENKYPKYFKMLQESMKNTHSIYQLRRIYVRENKSGVCPTLTANMGTGGHNVPLILDGKGNIRKLTPIECFTMQGFPINFNLPKTVSNGQLYKQAGNSVCVKVVKRIAHNIMKTFVIAPENDLEIKRDLLIHGIEK